MEEHSVQNLIHKFEKLSNKISLSIVDISGSPDCIHSKCAHQPNVGTRLKETDESLVKIPAFGGNMNPTVTVENRVRLINEMLKNISPDDKMAFYTIYNEMMDALIQLGSIDTNGRNSPNAKKECCLIELRNIKKIIMDWIALPSATTEYTGEMLDHAVTPMTSSVVLDTPFRNLRKKFDTLAAGVLDEHTEASKLSDEFLICNVNLQQLGPMDFSKIVNEHYSTSIADIDPDDYSRIQLIGEYLKEIVLFIGNHSLATKYMNELSNKLETLKSGRSLKTQHVSMPASDNTPISIMMEIPECISLACAANNKATERQSCQHSERLTTDYISTAIVSEGSSEVSEGNHSIEEDHLESSLQKLDHYTRLMQSYENNQDLLLHEDKITDQHEFLSHFTPHEAVLQYWEKLTQGYKDLVDVINWRKSELKQKDDSDDNDSENTILLDKVTDATSKYNEIIESIDLRIAENMDILTMNLEEVYHDFGNMQDIAESQRAKFVEFLKTVEKKLNEV